MYQGDLNLIHISCNIVLGYINVICRGSNISTNATYAKKNRQTLPLPPKQMLYRSKNKLMVMVFNAN
jgi:hypothetical protein